MYPVDGVATICLERHSFGTHLLSAGGRNIWGLKVDQAKRLKELEKENSNLNRLVAEFVAKELRK
jgi:hypothetical protein